MALDANESRTRNYLRELARRGYQVREFQTMSWSSVLWRSVEFVRAVIRADFVLCGPAIPWQLPWLLLARVFRRPCVLDCPMDITEWPYPKVRHWRWLVVLTFRAANRVLTLRSRGYLARKLGLPEDRVVHVESCPDRSQVEAGLRTAPRFRPRPEAFVVCCSGGSLHHRLERFLPIFEALVVLVPNAELLVIADPSRPLVGFTRSWAETSGLGERVHWLPVIKPVEEFFATLTQCHMWVATLGDDTVQGRHEFRMELMEIALLGKAIIAVRSPGLVEHGLRDGVHLLYIDPANVPESAARIAELARRPDALARLGGNLKSYVEEAFSLERAVDRILGSVTGVG